jgi:hypothetical protein
VGYVGKSEVAALELRERAMGAIEGMVDEATGRILTLSVLMKLIDRVISAFKKPSKLFRLATKREIKIGSTYTPPSGWLRGFVRAVGHNR